MKSTKRMLAYALSVIMVLSCFAGIGFTAKASESKDTAVEMTVGDLKTVTIDTPGQEYWVKFTPEETGKYVFYSQGQTDTIAELYDANEMLLETVDDGLGDGTNNFCLDYEMVAGETYYLRTTYHVSPDVTSYEILLVKATTPTAVSFDKETYKGYEGEYLDFDLLFTPAYAVEDFTFEVSQNGIIETWDNCYGAELSAPGTVTLTITSASGCTDTCTITVLEKEEIRVGDTKTINIEQDFPVSLKFTPETDGTYVFYSEDIQNGDFYLYDSTGHIGSSYRQDGFVVLSAELVAGETYEYQCFKHQTGTCNVSLIKAPAATGLSLNYDALEGYPGDEFYLEAVLEPRFSIEETFSFTSSNENVATVSNDGTVQFKKAGTATITVESENGLQDTCAVTIKAVTNVIQLDEKTVANIEEPGGAAVFAFTPQKTGTYAFYSDAKRDTYGYIHTSEGGYVNDDDDGRGDRNFQVNAELEAGKTYYLKACFYGESATGSYDVYVTELKAPTEMKFRYDELTGYVEEWKMPEVIYGPGVTLFEEWTMESHNTSVATVTVDNDVQFVAAGTAKLTATSENGLTCECTVLVKEPEALVLDQEKVVQINEEQSMVVYTFTPAETGKYALYSTDNHSGYCSLYDENQDYISGDRESGVGNNFKLVAELQAGQTYTYMYELWNENETTTKVKLQKTSEVTGIALSRSAVTGYVKGYASLKVDILPANSDTSGLSGQVTWTSSNPDVADIGGGVIMSLNNPYCQIALKKIGTATITAAWNGYTASSEVTVTATPIIKVNDTKTIKIEYADDYGMFEFTPEKDGTYIFSTNSDKAVYMGILDEERQIISEDYGQRNTPNVSLEVKLEAGKKYIVEVGYNTMGQIGEFTLTLIDKDNPPIDTPPSNTPESNTDSNTSGTTSTATGDSSVMWIWAVLMMAAVVVAIGTTTYRRKK